MNPMVDGWLGDDWFHRGAFRQINLSYIYEQEATRTNDAKWWETHYDDYDMYLAAGSAGALARSHGMEQLGFYQKLVAHPAYDSFWQDQAVDRKLAAEPLRVPTPAGAQPVGPGRYLRRHCRLQSDQTQGYGQLAGVFSPWGPGTMAVKSVTAARWARCAGAAIPPCGSASMCFARSLIIS